METIPVLNSSFFLQVRLKSGIGTVLYIRQSEIAIEQKDKQHFHYARVCWSKNVMIRQEPLPVGDASKSFFLVL